MKKEILLYLSAFILIVSCTKDKIVQVPVEIEKKNSWEEENRFWGFQRVFLSSGHSNNAIYFQQPGFFAEIKNVKGKETITQYGQVLLPTDINIHLPISGDYFPIPLNDSLLVLVNINGVVNDDYHKTIRLKSLDKSLIKIRTVTWIYKKCMAINNNGTLLLSYYNDRSGMPLTLLLIGVNIPTKNSRIDTNFTKQITIPNNYNYGIVRYMAAIDDYFLVDLGQEGLFKIKEDGSYKNVLNNPNINFIYRWNELIYATGELNNIFISSDNGDNWSEYSGITDVMKRSDYYIIGDSLVGVYKDNIFSLKWDNNNYTQSYVKNDGFENSFIYGIETLGDSVYVATLSGLYVKPLSNFFEIKE